MSRRRNFFENRTGGLSNFEEDIWNRPKKPMSSFFFLFFLFFLLFLSYFRLLGAPHLVKLAARDACTCNTSALLGNRTARPVNFEEDWCNHPNKLTNPSPFCRFCPCYLSFVGNDWDHSYILLGICQTRLFGQRELIVTNRLPKFA